MRHRHKSAYSYRARIGLIVPPTNTVNEAEWARMMPDGVTFHTVRMPVHVGHATEDARRRLVEDISTRARELQQARVDCVAYACTAGSMINPPHALAHDIAQRTGATLVTTAAAIVDALQSLAANRISVATPYHDELNRHEVDFLAGNGIEVLSIAGLGLGANGPADYPLIAETPLAAIESHARNAFRPGSEALLISCTDFPALTLIEPLEAGLGVPVNTSNQATLWAALSAAGISDPIPDAGRLLARPR
ncbi:MAG: maleate cis-trans isomerase [Hyphomicrobiaceae bacterium]